MSPRTILTLSNGKGIDLLNPRPEDIDFQAIAEHLGKETRYNGATPSAQYSVAQHCSIGCDAMLANGCSETEAAYFLLHDAHEALIKDLTTPLKEAVAEIAADHYRAIPAQIINAFHILELRVDAAIMRAAGLPSPMTKDQQRLVKKYDLIMFVTEWRDLMHDAPHPNWAPYSGIRPLMQEIQPQPWAHARAGWLLRANRLLPALRGRVNDVIPIPLAHSKTISQQGGSSA